MDSAMMANDKIHDELLDHNITSLTLRFQSMDFQAIFGISLSCIVHTQFIMQSKLCVMLPEQLLHTNNVNVNNLYANSLLVKSNIFLEIRTTMVADVVGM